MFHPKRRFMPGVLAGGSLLALALVGNLNHSFAQAVAEKAQESEAVAQSSSALSRVTKDIEILASDEYGGRRPGTPEMKLSEDYIIAAYRKAGLVDPTGTGKYMQTFEVSREKRLVEDACSLVITAPDGTESKLEQGEQYAQLLGRDDFDISGDLVFVGYGIDAGEEHQFNEYEGIDVDDKIVVMIRREPQQDNEDSVFDGRRLTRWSYISTKVTSASEAGAKGIIMVNDGVTADENGDVVLRPNAFGNDNGQVPFMQLKRSEFDKILSVTPVLTATGDKLSTIEAIETQLDKELEPLSQSLKGWQVKASGKFETGGIETSNIIGVIDGEGPNADETIVIGAHYDHLGRGARGSRATGEQRGMIHNGADDNATGTAAVMELARRFASREKRPARRLVFICFTAEEMGLLGAEHYVSNPLYPLKDTVAMINFDMIGWLRNERLTLFGWNSSAQFDAMFEAANKDLGFDLQKPASGFAGSDHLPFNQRKIPNTFIHTGLTSTYHTPDDDFKTINCEGAVQVIDFTEAFMDELINAEERPKYTFKRKPPFRFGSRFQSDEDGLKITRIEDDSIAEAAGLKKGDIIVLWDGEEIGSRRDFIKFIRRDKGKTVTLKILRDDEEMSIEAKLVTPEEDDE